MSEQGTGQALTFEEKVTKSSQVTSVTYDPGKQILSVIFKRTPFIYDYAAFPPEEWARLQAAESIGSFLYRNVTRPINGQLPYQFTKTPIPENSLPADQQPTAGA